MTTMTTDETVASTATPATETATPAAAEPAKVTTPAAEPAKETTPAAQEYVLEAPEGIDAETPSFAEFADIAREFNVPKERAEEFLSNFAQTQEAHIQQIHEEWRREAARDTEFGGVTYEKNVGLAKQALNKFGGEKLIEVLNQTGMGNHPEIIRAFYRVGKALGEGSTITNTVPQASRPQTVAEALQNLAKERERAAK